MARHILSKHQNDNANAYEIREREAFLFPFFFSLLLPLGSLAGKLPNSGNGRSVSDTTFNSSTVITFAGTKPWVFTMAKRGPNFLLWICCFRRLFISEPDDCLMEVRDLTFEPTFPPDRNYNNILRYTPWPTLIATLTIDNEQFEFFSFKGEKQTNFDGNFCSLINFLSHLK